MIGKLVRPMQLLKTAWILPIALLIFLSALVPNSHGAGAVSVRAELSRPEINAGEAAELQINVSGADGAKVPQEIAVEGLQIRLTGQSTQVQMVNFKVTSSAVYSYIVMPQRAGKFTIPSISVQTDQGTMQTRPLTFSVVDSSGAGQPSSAAAPSFPQPGMPGFSQPSRAVRQRSDSPNGGQLAFGEITCSKKTFYAGEMIPVEIRYYFNANYPGVRVTSNVDFGSEGLLVERTPDPKQSQEDRDGIPYLVLTYHTLLSAVKPGPIDIPFVKLQTQVQLPGAVPPGFDAQLIQQMMGGQNPFVQTRDLTVKTAPLHLEVLPLPKEGKPASFAGAVGQFDIDAMVANPKPAPGDPAMLTIKIGGKGNFKAMGAPVLTETDGWRTYPPADKFDSSDALSYEGVKSFDFTLIAQEQKTNSPGSEFSYFDPVAEKYVTLATKPLPLKASPASGAASPTPIAAAQSTPQQGGKPSPTVTAKVGEGEPLSTMTLHSWKTPAQRSEFLIASLGMLLASVSLAGILQFRRYQTQQGSASSRRRRLASLWSSLNSESLDAAASYDAALEYVELLGASENEAELAALTARRDALKYGVGGSVMLAGEERARLIETLRKLPHKA